MELKRIFFIVFAVFILILVSCAKISNKDSDNYKCPDCNVILISITNVGAEHLGTYGYFRNTSPNIDEFAKESIVFENAFSPASWTLPTGTSLFTSLYPYTHGVMDRLKGLKLNPNATTLIDILKSNGYKTAIFSSGFDYRTVFGLTDRFDVIEISDKDPIVKHSGGEFFYDDSYRITVNGPKAIEWVKKNRDNKFFLFLQGYDAHCPFNPPEPYNSLFWHSSYPNNSQILSNECVRGYKAEDSDKYFAYYPKKAREVYSDTALELSEESIQYMESQYDGEISYVDNFLGEFFDSIEKEGILENTIVIILSEHGEMFAKYGRFGRAGTIRGTLFDDVIHIPLIIKHPKLSPKRVHNLVQIIDIMPTILDFLNIPIIEEAQGKSLVPLIVENKTVNNFVFAGSNYGRLNFDIYSVLSVNEIVRDKDWKLMHEISYLENGTIIDEYNLFKIDESGEEPEVPLTEQDAIFKRFKKLLSDWRASVTPDDTAIATTNVSEEFLETARKLGYW